MKIPKEYLKDYEAMPAVLRALLDAELAAGNSIVEVGHSFPAPPVGAYFKLASPVTTRPRAAGDGLKFRDRNSSISSGEFTDEKGFFFIVEPPGPPPPEPDMDAIRAAANISSTYVVPSDFVGNSSIPERSGAVGAVPGSPLDRFIKSMVIDYEKWHDGIGYDLEALRDASPAERKAIESMLLSRPPRDWRDIEALARIDNARARELIRGAINDPDARVRTAVTRYAPHLVRDVQRVQSLVAAIESAEFFGGLGEALDEIAEFHPPRVVDALFRGVLRRGEKEAVSFVALLFHIHGKTPARFDMNLRPYFLKFHTSDPQEREVLFREMCDTLGVDVKRYLPNKKRGRGKTT